MKKIILGFLALIMTTGAVFAAPAYTTYTWDSSEKYATACVQAVTSPDFGYAPYFGSDADWKYTKWSSISSWWYSQAAVVNAGNDWKIVSLKVERTNGTFSYYRCFFPNERNNTQVEYAFMMDGRDYHNHVNNNF